MYYPINPMCKDIAEYLTAEECVVFVSDLRRAADEIAQKYVAAVFVDVEAKPQPKPYRYRDRVRGMNSQFNDFDTSVSEVETDLRTFA